VNQSAYNLTNIQKNYTVEVTYRKTLSWYLSQGKWKCDSVANLRSDGIYDRYLVWGVPGAAQYVYSFLPNGSYALDASGFESGGTWTITGEEKNSPVLNLKSNNVTIVWKIEQLDGVFLTLFNDQIPLIGDPTHQFTNLRYKYSHLK